jgi:hypothetical protein
MITLFIILSNNFFEVNHEIIANKIQTINQNTETITQKIENLIYKIDNTTNDNFLRRLFNLSKKDYTNLNYNYSNFSINNPIKISSNEVKNFLNEQAILNFKYKATQGLIVDIKDIIKDYQNAKLIVDIENIIKGYIK